jgi:hypothetical protein
MIGSGASQDGCIAERWGREERESFAPLRPGSVVTLDAGLLGRQSGPVLPPGPIRAPLRDRREPRGPAATA